MPSQHQPSDSSERARNPDIKAEIGEDPARWLDCDLTARTQTRLQPDNSPRKAKYKLVTDTDTSTRGKMLRARIRGIDSLAVLRHWFEVENRLDRGPRQQVLDLLHQRADYLKEAGQRPDRLPHGPRPTCDCCDDDGLTAADLRKQERTTTRQPTSTSAPSTAESSTSSSASTLDQFATAGGDDE